jgi:hypothetical protein
VPKKYMLDESQAGLGENLIEHVAHGEDGWARLDTETPDLHPPHLSTGRLGTFQEHDVAPRRRQQQRRHEAPDPGTDHDGLAPFHTHLLRDVTCRGSPD